MSDASSAPLRGASPWIISAPWDLAFLIATPLAIVPLVTAAQRWWMTPETLALWVVSFASIGHHLPGFMRAYGDRELFRRFRWRFLLAPPLLLALAGLFALRGSHGLELILLFWATWHALMQTYGFMRIYDLKRGVREPLEARLDWALCLTIFAAGMVFSDARVFGVVEALWLTGAPLLDRAWLVGLRWTVGVTTCGVLAVYAGHAIALSRRPAGVTWAKVALAATTGFLYWLSGALVTSMLVGVAMFEIFHAVQYYAIVWSYNRRLADRVGERFGPLGFLFQDRWAFLLIYLAAIVAFGAIRFFGDGIADPRTQSLLLAALTASAMLHFYYDGFIWKVRETVTQANLGIAERHAGKGRDVTALAHAGKWSVFAAAVLGLLWLETNQGPTTADQQRALLARLESWTPNLPELQFRVARQALHEGEVEKALTEAQQAARLRPRSHLAHAVLGAALAESGNHHAAAEALERAVSLAPGEWRNHFEWAAALDKLEHWDAADQQYAAAARLAPREPAVHHAWGGMYARRGAWSQALPHLREAWELAPDLPEVRRSLVLADFQLGNAAYTAGRLPEAREHYEACIRLAPDFPDAYNNLGAILFEQEELEAAAQAYRRTLELKPDDPAAHYNLGLLYLNLDDRRQALAHVRRAAELGQAPTPEVQAYLGL